MGNGKLLISVIVPIYRIDRYLGECIESILRQTYNNLQIILVDDGSDDRCGDICDLYAKKDNRIKVIHKPNGGLVSARKAGAEQSKGSYIGYVDGDDWLDEDYIECMLADAVRFDADVVCGGYKRDLFNKSVKMLNSCPAGFYTGEDLDKLRESMISCEGFYRPGINTYVWNKLFKRDLLVPRQMKVDERITIGEDAAVTYPVIMDSSSVCVNECVSYHYRQREGSMLKKSASFEVETDNLKRLYEFMLGFAKEYADYPQLEKQIVDYVLAACIIRSGGRVPGEQSFSAFDKKHFGGKVVVYNAGTFGQQLINRFNESNHCEIVKWIDDDFWEYRRWGMDVDPVESVSEIEFDYVLIATVDCLIADKIKHRMLALGVDPEKMLFVQCPGEMRQTLIFEYLY